jgi:membrane protein required for beta-lactamase induction
MTLIALAFALLLERLIMDPQRYRTPERYEAVLRWIRRRVAGSDYWDGWPGLLAVALPGPILVGLVMDAVADDGILSSVLGIVVAALVLFWSLGTRELQDRAEGFLMAYESGNETEARRLTREIMGAEPPTHAEQWPASVTYNLLARVNDRLFAILFWFLVFGPLGAVLYRTSALLAARAADPDGVVATPFDRAAVQLHHGLGWLPARLVALVYALVGSFEQTFEGWRSFDVRCVGRFRDHNAALLVCAGIGALGLGPNWYQADRDQVVTTTQVRAALHLLKRALIVWLAVVGVMTLAGWLS